MAAPNFEIGVVYKKNSRYYLAVTERTLVSLKNNKLVEIKPYVKYTVMRQMPVADLCRRWKVCPTRIDEISRQYFAPSPDGIKSKVVTRSSTLEQDRAHRLYRVFRKAS